MSQRGRQRRHLAASGAAPCRGRRGRGTGQVLLPVGLDVREFQSILKGQHTQLFFPRLARMHDLVFLVPPATGAAALTLRGRASTSHHCSRLSGWRCCRHTRGLPLHKKWGLQDRWRRAAAHHQTQGWVKLIAHSRPPRGRPPSRKHQRPPDSVASTTLSSSFRVSESVAPMAGAEAASACAAVSRI